MEFTRRISLLLLDYLRLAGSHDVTASKWLMRPHYSISSQADGTKDTSKSGHSFKPSPLTAILTHLLTRDIAVKHCQLDLLLIRLAMQLVHRANCIANTGVGRSDARRKCGQWVRRAECAGDAKVGVRFDRGGQCFQCSSDSSDGRNSRG
jgi:hypothetical protein